MKVQALVFSAFAAAVTIPAANAAPMAISTAEVTLELTSVTNLVTPGDFSGLIVAGETLDFFTDSETFMAPSSMASVSILQTLLPSTPVFFEPGSESTIGHTLSASASGDNAFGTAVTELEGTVSIDNISPTDSYEVEFTASYSASIATAITDPVADLAIADSGVFIANSIDGILFADFIALDSFFDGSASDDIAPDTLTFSMIIAPFASESATIATTGFVVADVLVPLPSTMLLLAAAPLLLRRRQRI